MSIVQLDEFVLMDPSSARMDHPEKYEGGISFINGDYCDRTQATIPLYDLGFLHSDATYEVATVSRGRFFRLKDHFERFARSAAAFRLRCPYDERQMEDILSTLLRSAGLRHAHVFWCLTRGLPKPGASSYRDRNNPAAFENRFYAGTYAYSSLFTQEQRNRGLDIVVSQRYIRIHPKAVDPRAKNFHWLDMKQALFEAHDQEKDWSVLTDIDGYLTECPGANIFVIKNGSLYTPDSGCLEGITRSSALELAAMIGVPAHVEKVHVNQLREADEAFLTSSGGGIVPINSVDGLLLGGAEGPGELATKFHNLYWEKMWEGWKCTPVRY